MASSEQQQMGNRLDEHHRPETNGRMSVCRRCGVITDGPDGDHAPRERELARTGQWLDTQARIRRIEGAKERVNR
jgi:hypothetical protein